jgi:alkaline phosphatase
MVAAGKGVGSEKIRGFMDNTEIFKVLHDAL